MSEITENNTPETAAAPPPTPEIPSIDEATDTIKNLLENLIPPESIEVKDIFGVVHKLPSTTSARSQIKIVRMLEELKDVALPVGFQFGGIQPKEIITLLGTLVSNETVFETVCKAAELAHPKLVKAVVAKAQEQDVEYDPDLPIADLLPIEEAIACVVPLFLSIARRTGQAINKIAVAANQ